VVRAKAESVRAARADAAALDLAIDRMVEALDDFGQLWDQRQRIVEAD
jgi:hypothetical protein